VGWNGHYLVGYSVAIIVILLITVKIETVHADAPAPAPSHSASSSCEQLRQERLDGSPASIVESMKRIVKDETANDTAREWAGYYIGRDGTNESRQATEIELIQFYCGL
jgi:hypothetical protein